MDFSAYLKSFVDHPNLAERVERVLNCLPHEVQQDFLQDQRFGVELEDYVPGRGWSLFMPTPGPLGQGSRRVVLRPRLETATQQFAEYIIAHEFAHAFLRNGGWGDMSDPEEAADAMAATWGFQKVSPTDGR